ncbi:MAG: hypothetical protein AAB421_02480 [Patescibacteria group bacterium]
MKSCGRSRFSRLWQRLGASTNGVSEHAELLRHYGDSTRAYHNLAHIGHCLEVLDAVHFGNGDSDIIELALWYHDVIYDSRGTDNEGRSIALFLERASSARLPESVQRSVVLCIEATRHREIATEMRARVTADIDLVILGTPDEQFDAYEVAIRKEYAWVPEDVFARERAKVLRHFLGRAQIYSIPTLNKKYGLKARMNLERGVVKCLMTLDRLGKKTEG